LKIFNLCSLIKVSESHLSCSNDNVYFIDNNTLHHHGGGRPGQILKNLLTGKCDTIGNVGYL